MPGDELSIVPVNDLINHTQDDCPCGPTTVPCEREDGSIAWIIVHHSLDGREGREERL